MQQLTPSYAHSFTQDKPMLWNTTNAPPQQQHSASMIQQDHSPTIHSHDQKSKKMEESSGHGMVRDDLAMNNDMSHLMKLQ